MGRNQAAAGVLQSLLEGGDDPVAAGASIVAKGWLTRLDREQLPPVLQAYYRHEVGYPATLADLKGHPKLPEAEGAQLPQVDRFGEAWDYKLVGFGKIPGFENQRYSLQSPRLGAASELAVALEAPYGSSIQISPARIMRQNPPMVVLQQNDGAAGAIPAGEEWHGVHLAFIGEQIVVVCDHTY